MSNPNVELENSVSRSSSDWLYETKIRESNSCKKMLKLIDNFVSDSGMVVFTV